MSDASTFLAEIAEPVVEDAVDAPIKTVSFSLLKQFESCKYAAFLSKVKKFKGPSSEAADRGTAMHQDAEDCVRDGTPVPKSLQRFETGFIKLQEEYAEGRVILEEEWGFTKDWEPVTWSDPNLWLLMKLDVFHREDETSARVIDHKSGKKMGNEIKHSDQCLLYGIASFMRYPELEHITTELWYLDKGEKLTKPASRAHAMKFLQRYNDRLLAVTSETEFTPSPSTYNCRWCPHKATGNCEWAVTE